MADLTSLTARIRACSVCRDAPLGAPLPHEPRPVVRVSGAARLLIAGQAPGLRVNASGVPFDDASGDRLRTWLGVGAGVFYDETRIAIAPMGFCFPGYDAKGSDLPPRRECAPLWRPSLMAALPQIETVVAVGRHAQAWHLAGHPLLHARVDETVRRWRAIFEQTRPRVFVAPHPSWRNTGWLKRNPWFEAEALPVLRAEVARLVGP